MCDDVERLAHQAYAEFAVSQRQHVIDNPVCEVCNKQPSVRINRWGAIKACCEDCLAEELRLFNEATQHADDVESDNLW